MDAWVTLLRWPPGVPGSLLSAQALPGPRGLSGLPRVRTEALCSLSRLNARQAPALLPHSPVPSTWAANVGSVGFWLMESPPRIPPSGVPREVLSELHTRPQGVPTALSPLCVRSLRVALSCSRGSSWMEVCLLCTVHHTYTSHRKCFLPWSPGRGPRRQLRRVTMRPGGACKAHALRSPRCWNEANGRETLQRWEDLLPGGVARGCAQLSRNHRAVC